MPNQEETQEACQKLKAEAMKDIQQEAVKTYQLPVWGKTRLDRKVEKLNRRANKIGCPPMEVKVIREWQEKEMAPDFDQTMVWTGRYIHMFELELVGEPPKINGWEFIAALTHTPAGNIIRRTPLAVEQELAPADKYRKAPSACDHCNTNRKRHNTFLVRSVETGEVKQIGSSCLVDFLGHRSPDVYLCHDKMLADIDDLMDGDWKTVPGDFKEFNIDVKSYLWHVCQFVLDEGFISRTKAYNEGLPWCTSSLAINNMFPPTNTPKEEIKAITEEAKELTEKVLAWGETLEERANGPEGSEYHNNLAVCFVNGYISHKEMGLLASAPSAYQREVEAEVKRKSRPDVNSQHFGEIKKREVFTLKLMSVRTWENDYGTTWFHRFLDENGNVAVWYGSLPLEYKVGVGMKDVQIGDVVKVKATVKKHDEYKGIKQTVVNRCKVEEWLRNEQTEDNS